MNDELILQQAKQCFQIEKNALSATADSLGDEFVAVVHQLVAACKNDKKILFTGIGKNMPIAQKLVGTFNSIGVASCLLDATQALHGDVGICRPGDIVLLFSYSGGSRELIELIPILKRLSVQTIAVTVNTQSEMASLADQILPYQVPEEACPLQLAPTASTTAALALGDALAMTLLRLLDVTTDDFARFHPAGNLGRRLLLRVGDVMRAENRFAKAPDHVDVKTAIIAITAAQCGTVALFDDNTKQLTGVFSDGDFRRLVLSHPDALEKPVKDHMTQEPVSIREDELVVDALKKLESFRINDLIVVDTEQHPVGVIDGQDLPKLKII